MQRSELGFWWGSLGGPPPPRPPLPGPMEADVAIVGAGYTGLWTAYYLKRARPSLRVVVIERQMAGFGASGRNGGWVSGFFSGPARAYVRRGGREGLLALQQAMFDSVDEVGRVLAEHQLEAGFCKGGQLGIALNAAQAQRLRDRVAEGREYGLGEGDLRELSASQLGERVRIAGARGATYTPHVARVHPARLLTGLTGIVERLGVEIHEGTPVTAIRPHLALTPYGAVRARWVVRATEGYTAGLDGLKRLLVPMNSSMIITEPLGSSVWEELGWDGRELLADGAHLFVYLQRTEDGRIAIGGRGVPYRFGSRTDRPGDTSAATIANLRERLRSMFPPAAGAELDHAWSGVLGVPRDWCPSVNADPGTGIAWGGGYVGEGVAAANLAGRMLRDLMMGDHTSLTGLPWVGREPRRWAPEPLRWGAIRSIYALYRRADRVEQRLGHPSRLGRLIDRASGRE